MSKNTLHHKTKNRHQTKNLDNTNKIYISHRNQVIPPEIFTVLGNTQERCFSLERSVKCLEEQLQILRRKLNQHWLNFPK